eukprot:13041330-Heterocapsa_arctica.AAC.1
MEFEGIDEGHCVIQYSTKDQENVMHRVYCPDTGAKAYLDTSGLHNVWVWEFERGAFYSIVISKGFGRESRNGIIILALGKSKAGPEGPYCIPVTKLLKPGQWAVSYTHLRAHET